MYIKKNTKYLNTMIISKYHYLLFAEIWLKFNIFTQSRNIFKFDQDGFVPKFVFAFVVCMCIKDDDRFHDGTIIPAESYYLSTK